jgi:hypothetical protein
MNELSQVLADATSAIEPGYFRLNVDGGDSIYRERVYCYELYHQMRSRWPASCPFFLNGEIDKAAHPILIELGAFGAKPDLLVHQPGYMIGNHAIIEVKCASTRGAGIKKDLDTLTLFINKVRYQRAIYLIYGDECRDGLITRIRRTAKAIEDLAPVELWIHASPGQPAAHIDTLTNETPLLGAHRR